jgi:hypothetical protein
MLSMLRGSPVPHWAPTPLSASLLLGSPSCSCLTHFYIYFQTKWFKTK